MPTRLVIRGRPVWQNLEAREAQQLRQKQAKATPRGRDGALLTEAAGNGQKSPARGISAGSPDSPFQAGVGWLCREERLVYRVVSDLNPLDNWAPTEFWQARWTVSHAVVLTLAREGLLDAALEQGSQVRRYRCRDEARCVRHESVLRAALERRTARQERARDDKTARPKRVNGRWVKG